MLSSSSCLEVVDQLLALMLEVFVIGDNHISFMLIFDYLGSDLEAEKDTGVVLLRLSDASGKFEFKEVAKGKQVSKSLLDSNDVFVLYTGAEVFAWVGKKASVGEKKKALSFAQEYVTKAGLPPHTPVARILEGGENEIFEASFN